MSNWGSIGARPAHRAEAPAASRAVRRSLLALLLVPALVLPVVVASPASAAVVAGFEIDGNVADDNPAVNPPIDWSSLPDPLNPGPNEVDTHATDPTGNDDTSNFGEGSKEFAHPSTWVRKTGVAPDQDDISDVYFHDDIVDGDIWGYVGFRRLTATGVTNFDVEFNRLRNSNDFAPVRSLGDVMVRFEQDGTSSTFKLTAGWFWTATNDADWSSSSCIAVPGYPAPGYGWCEEEPISAIPFTGTTGEAGKFAEGAFNFSSLLEAGGIGGATCAGGDFGTMNIRSFTGNDNQSSLKDFVKAVTIDIDDTCGELEIYKRDQLGNLLSGATFSISPNPIPGQSASPLVVTEGVVGQDPDGEADGDITFKPATPETYTVIETAGPPPAGDYELVPLDERTWLVTVTDEETTWILAKDKDAVPAPTPTDGPLTVVNRRWFAPPTMVHTPRYNRDHDWLVTKTVTTDRTVQVPDGTDATFGYEVRLKAVDPVPADYSNFRGTVSLTNPNAYDMVVTLSANIVGGADCTITDGPTLDVDDETAGIQVNLKPGSPPGNTFAYTCATPANPGAASARVTVDWDTQMYPQKLEADEPPVTDTAAFGIGASTDLTTSVTDVFDGDDTTAETWGPFNWNTVRASQSPAAHTIVVATYVRGDEDDDIDEVAGTCTDYDNVVTLSNDPSTDTETVTVCVGKDLSVTKTAELGFQREYFWDIAKSGPGTVFVGEENGERKTKVEFEIDVTATEFTDGEFALTGEISLENPNTWKVMGTISDTVEIGTKTLTCDVDAPDDGAAAGHQVEVPAKKAGDVPELVLTYECVGVEQGDYVGTNTVTFDYSADVHEYPDGDDTATDDATVEVVGDTEPKNETVTIKDLLAGEDVTADLPESKFSWEEVDGTDGTDGDGGSVSFTYTTDYLSTPPGECTPYKNEVSIVEIPTEKADATAVICAPGVEKTYEATYGQKQLWSLDKAVEEPSRAEVPAGQSHTFEYTVTATKGAVVDNGEVSWSGSVTVTNPSQVEDLTFDVEDISGVAGWTCEFDVDATGLTIQAGGDPVVLGYTCTTAGSSHPDGTNTAVVSFGDDQSVSDTVDVAFVPETDAEDKPVIDDTKVAIYDTMTNPDPEADPVLLGYADASKPGPYEFPYELVKDGVAGECTPYQNTATLVAQSSTVPPATVDTELCVEKPLGVAVEGSGSYGATYTWALDKLLDEPQMVEVDAETGEWAFDYEVQVKAGTKTDEGWSVGGTVTVTNPNTDEIDPITLTGIELTTTLTGGAACTATLPEDPVVASGDDLVIPFTCSFTGPPEPLTGKVTAKVTWGDSRSSTGTDETVPLTIDPDGEIDKTVEVWDDKTDPENPELLDTLTWEKDGVWTFPYTLTHSAEPGTCETYTNEAWIETAEGDDQTPRLITRDESSDTTTAEICVEAPLSASMTASGGLARDYAWSIDKAVDKTSVTVSGGSATFNYTVVVRAGASKDSAWRASGVVTVANPNAYGDSEVDDSITLTGATMTNTFGPGVTCAPDAAVAGRVVPGAGEGGPGTIQIPFTCTFANAPAATSGTISASVSWDPAGDEVDSDTADASTGVVLGLDKETNKVVDAVDDKTVPGRRIVLEQGLTWAAGLVKSYTYSLALPAGAAGTTTPYTNIATVDLPEGPDVSDTVTVQVSVPEVAPEQAFGKATGKVRASCQGTVTARMRNATGGRVTYVLKVGKKTHRIKVASGKKRVFQTKGKARAKVVLKVGPQTLDRVRVPRLCLPPEVLPETGMRAAANARLGSITHRWG